MIYFLRRANGDVKIGTTDQFHARKLQLSKMHGELQLLGLMDGGRAVEQSIHKRFARYRLARTEWFQPAPALEVFIAEMTHMYVPDNPYTVIRTDEVSKQALDLFAAEHTALTGQRLTIAASLHHMFTQYRPDLLVKAELQHS